LSELRSRSPATAWGDGTLRLFGTLAHNPPRELSRSGFFYFFRSNPLKNPKSAKQNQRKSKDFAWIYLE
jgi:hypothetical protein